MDTKNQGIIIGLLALIVGLLLGYFFASSALSQQRGFFSSAPMHEAMEEEMGEHIDGDESMHDDGELQHMMDEMLLVARGKTGEAYEEAWLRGMVVHHLGAVRMSEALLEHTERPELVELAESIIESKSAEVEQMESWLEAWFATN